MYRAIARSPSLLRGIGLGLGRRPVQARGLALRAAPDGMLGRRKQPPAAGLVQHMPSRRFSIAAGDEEERGSYSEADHEHAVISTFDLFSIGIGPSSSHTVGPMRAGNIFVTDLIEAGLLEKVDRIRVSVYGSLALTGEGHMTPSALLLGLESANVETVDTAYVPERFAQIKKEKKLFLGHGLPGGGGKEVAFDYERDFVWEWGKKLPMHSNGMRFRVFDKHGYMLATNDLFSVGGGFVVNGALSINPDLAPGDQAGETALAGTGEAGHPADLAENMYYKEIRRGDAAGDRKTGVEIKQIEEAAKPDTPTALVGGGQDATAVADTSSAPPAQESDKPSSHQPRYPFRDAQSLLTLCKKHNLTIAQLVYENEKSHGYTDDDIHDKVYRIWQTMDNSILEGVQAPVDSTLPGSLKLHRRAPALYRRLTRGLYPTHTQATGEQMAIASDEKAKIAAAESTKAVARAEPGSKRALPPRVHGSLYHPIMPSPLRRTTFPAMDHLSVYAMGKLHLTRLEGRDALTGKMGGTDMWQR